MVRMVSVNRQSVAFCKYVIASLLWLSLILRSQIPVYIVLVIMLISIVTGVDKSPLVLLFDKTIAKLIKVKVEYINMHSMRFAHIVGAVFCVLALLNFYFLSHIIAYVLIFILAIMQTIASLGYCSAQKLYECVVCNSNCCNLGNTVRRFKNNVR